MLNPEVCDIDPEDANARSSYTKGVKDAIGDLGIEELILLRDLDRCEFSFGFTRVGSTPSTTVKDLEMPVRLKAFAYSEKNKRPISLQEGEVHVHVEAFRLKTGETAGDNLEPLAHGVEMIQSLLQSEVAQVVGA